MSDEQTDDYGNQTIDGEIVELIYCVHPDCGCDGARLCMAKNGASNRAIEQNVEGMYSRRDPAAQKAKAALILGCREDELKRKTSK